MLDTRGKDHVVKLPRSEAPSFSERWEAAAAREQRVLNRVVTVARNKVQGTLRAGPLGFWVVRLSV